MKYFFSLVFLAATIISCSGGDDGGEKPLIETETTLVEQVVEYVPAPGQFVNKMPVYDEGDTQATMNAKVLDYLKNGYTVSLGGFGGFVTLKLREPIENKAGLCDFRILGNAYAGSSEAGVIMVSQNGSEWYEIHGSEHSNATQGYRITYTKPTSAADDVAWTDSEGVSGVIAKVYGEHSQAYYPEWISDASISFEGNRLVANVTGSEGNFVLHSFKYGYADNVSNTNAASAIDIDWAKDESGNAANLSSVQYIKIYNGLNQQNGSLGESSTEVAGVENLHLLGVAIDPATLMN